MHLFADGVLEKREVVRSYLDKWCSHFACFQVKSSKKRMHLHIFLLLQKRECVMASEMFSDVKISNQMT
jgi:hypothetical protein